MKENKNTKRLESDFGPLRIIVEGRGGATGKTTVQLIIADALRKLGLEVDCVDTSWGIDRPRQFESMIASHFATLHPVPLIPLKVTIDVKRSNERAWRNRILREAEKKHLHKKSSHQKRKLSANA